MGSMTLSTGSDADAAQGVDGRFQRLQEEIGVFEVAEQAEVADDADSDEQAPPARGGEPIQAAGDQIVRRGGSTYDEGQLLAPAGVEVEAGPEQ